MNIHSALFVDRGTSGANMTTLDCKLEVFQNKSYVLTKEGLALSNKTLYAIDLEHVASKSDKIEAPSFLEVAAVWDTSPIASGSKNNILGDNGRLILRTEEIAVPVVTATSERLAYYGATLIKEGDVVQFANDNYPIFSMEVGNDYVDQFIMTEEGGGFYLEYHHDKPHFHMPLKGGGYYLLAKWAEDNHLHITAFQIYDGDAVYTKKGAIHCDAALTGKLIVGYDNSQDCSTVLLRDQGGKMVKLKFE